MKALDDASASAIASPPVCDSAVSSITGTSDSSKLPGVATA